ncbi:transcription factor bHLH104-like [Rhodamnia argentea]|uniref:Transcription factor bHLH104-like n=1 Tax=Rhodamnia argentea TaxID=178133 RepID=A0A8B8PIC1_9MYRT|nr:transcription factor bHLH104-like [Rhodamnia argentea]
MDSTELGLGDDPSCWDFLDCASLFGDAPSTPSPWPPHNPSAAAAAAVGVDFPAGGVASAGDDLGGAQCPRKRGRNDACNQPQPQPQPRTKACREKLRRERLNDRFLDLSSILEPGRSIKTEKTAVLDDAIRVLTQLRAESEELKETNEKLQEEIKCLKAEKNELREEKLSLKADKERMEQQLKAMTVPPAGFVPPHPATAYHAGANKMPVFPSYGYIPMWQYMPPAARDTSSDHELRPPAA